MGGAYFFLGTSKLTNPTELAQSRQINKHQEIDVASGSLWSSASIDPLGQKCCHLAWGHQAGPKNFTEIPETFRASAAPGFRAKP